VRALGCYDDVVTYDRLEFMPVNGPVAFVDMAGNADLRARLHRHFGEAMRYSGRVGLTHHGSADTEVELPGAKPTWFFAPDQIRKRAKEWGPGDVDKRFAPAFAGFAATLDRWLTVVEGRGPDAVRRVYLDTLGGRIPPDQGHMLSLGA